MYFVYVRDRFTCLDFKFDQLIGVFDSQVSAKQLQREFKEAFFPNHIIEIEEVCRGTNHDI